MDQSKPLFFFQRGMGCRFSRAIPIFDMVIRSGDIRDQSRNVSKIAKICGRFFGRHKFLRAGLVKIVPKLSPCLAMRRLKKKSREDTPTKPEVIDLKTLNFRPDC